MIIEIDTAAFNPEGVSEIEKIHDTPSGFGFQYPFCYNHFIPSGLIENGQPPISYKTIPIIDLAT